MSRSSPRLGAVLSLMAAALVAGCGADDPVDAVVDGAVQLVDATAPESDAEPCSALSVSGFDEANIAIPDSNKDGLARVITIDDSCVQVATVQIRLDITHTYRGDIEASVIAPSQETIDVLVPRRDPNNDIHETFDLDFTAGQPAGGEWILNVADVNGRDRGTLDRWSIGINEPAP